MSVGSKMFVKKEVLNRLEADAPGTKQAFYFGFLERQKQEDLSREDEKIQSCTRCGQPTTAAICSYCRILEKVKTAQ